MSIGQAGIGGALRRRYPGIGAETLILAALGLYVVVLCVWPLARLLATIFADGATEGISFLMETWSGRAAQRATWNTLEASFLATVLSVLLGGAMALIVALTDLRYKALLVFLLLLPLLIPPQISALAWLAMIGPQSPLWLIPGLEALRPARNPLLGRDGIVLVMGLEHAPMVFLAVRAALRSLPADLIDAARAAGSRPLGALARVILPLMLPAITAGAALAFVSAIGNFGVPALLGIPGRYPMLSTLIYQRLSGFGPGALPEVAALALILAGMAVIGIVIQTAILRSRSAATDRVGGMHAGFSLGRWFWPMTLFVWALMLLIAVMPLVSLAASALVPSVGMRLTWETLTFDNLIYVVTGLGSAQRAFVNSLFLAGAAAAITVSVCAPLAWLMVARRSRVAQWLNIAADAPYVLPGIVLSIAVILVLLPPLPIIGISLYNTIWILLFAYLARFLALALRPVVAAMAQLDRAGEEAAQMAGARPFFRLRTIVLPLLAPALGAGAILVFLGAFSELTVSALLWSRGSETVGVVIFSLYDEGNSTAAAAVSVWVLLIILALAFLVSLLGRRLPEGVLPWRM
ncbi:MAG: iron ABC transporter permease [Salinarimonas sp.]|nr:iron ABC transporter permease [Salinarimonas sp.]